MTRRTYSRFLAVCLGSAALVGCNGIDPQPLNYFSKPLVVTGNRTFVDITTGDFHSCGLLANGDAYCWGSNAQGQSGNGTTAVGDSIPRIVTGAHKFSSISAGGNHTCGILLDGTTMCWGNNVGGQLGTGNNVDKLEPTLISGGHLFVQISASTIAHTCALKANGDAWCWGINDQGQLGIGTHTYQNAPALVGGGVKFISITTGAGHSCGLATDSSAYCWGLNAYGQLGDGTTAQRLIPTKVATALKFKALVAGTTHTCGLSSVGVAYCWGDNVIGALGDGTSDSKSVPTLVKDGPTYESIAAGERHNCAVKTDGAVACWGYNELGQLGDGTLQSRTEPVAVSSTVAFKKVAGGAVHTCGISTANVTYCWGSNYSLQLGTAIAPP